MSDIDELRKSVRSIIVEPTGNSVSTADIAVGFRSSSDVATMVDNLMRLITQYGDKRELEGRIDELHYIPSNFFVVKDGVETRVDDRLAELKKQRGE